MNIKKGTRLLCVNIQPNMYADNPFNGETYIAKFNYTNLRGYDWIQLVGEKTGQDNCWLFGDFKPIDDILSGLDKEIIDLETMGYREYS